jgi:hypothetical protein
MNINSIFAWHYEARPYPNKQDFDVQLGCHFEEVLEMLDTFVLSEHDQYRTLAKHALAALSLALKRGEASARVEDRKEFLDAVCDQIVTGIGAAYCAKMFPVTALEKVDKSNWSKFDEHGRAIRNRDGKIIKGPNYQKPDLSGLY